MRCARGLLLLLLLAAPSSAEVDHILEAGVGVGRYAFDPGDETSGFDSQFLRWTRARPGVDTWRLEVGRQHRFDESSLDGGVSYTRHAGATAFTAGLSSGTSDVLAPEYRLDLGVTRPVLGFQIAAGYTRVQSKAENRSDGWNVGVTRWLPHLILSAGHRVDYGHPGDTTSHSTSLGATWYRWRETYVGVGVDFGEVSYVLLPEGTPLTDTALIDYDAWTLRLSLTRYLGDDHGVNLRYEHGRAEDFWDTDGVVASYFREW